MMWCEVPRGAASSSASLGEDGGDHSEEQPKADVDDKKADVDNKKTSHAHNVRWDFVSLLWTEFLNTP